MKRALYLATVAMAIGLVAPAANPQQSNLDLRFRVPFQFTIDNKMFAAGEYQITCHSHFLLNIHNRTDHTTVFESVRPAQSRHEGNGHVRLIFHRYGDQYYLAAVSSGGWESTYDFTVSKKEQQLAYESPRTGAITVSVATDGAVQVATDSLK